MDPDADDERSRSGKSTFHVLLKQLGEEHDRELGQFRSPVRDFSPTLLQRSASDIESYLPLRSSAGWRPSGEVSIQAFRHNRFNSLMLTESGQQASEFKTSSASEFKASSSGTSVREASPFVAAADAMTRVRTLTSMENATSLSYKGSRESHGGFVKLYPEWNTNTDELRFSRNFSNSQTVLTFRGSMTSTEANSAGVDQSTRLCPGRRELISLARILCEASGIPCVVFDLVWIPIQLGFGADATGWVFALDWAVRIYWTLEIVVKFLLVVWSSLSPLDSLKPIPIQTRQSGQFWRIFALDLSIVITDWIPSFVPVGSSAVSLGLLRAGRIPRILRILRVLRAARTIKLEYMLFLLRYDLLASSESVVLLLGLLKNMLSVLACCHISACVWYYLGDGPSDDHWVYFHRLSEPDVPLHVKYVWSFHWVTCQWTPASMEVFPRNVWERYFSVVLTMAGLVTFATFMGAVTASITRLRGLAGQELSQFFLLRRYLHENGISRSLTIRICRYTDRALELHRKSTSPEKVQYLKLLTGPLCVELQKEIYLPHLCKLPFFASYHEWDPEALSHLCFMALGRASVAKGDTIFSLGAKAGRMYSTATGTWVYQRRRGLKLFAGRQRPHLMARVGPSVWCCEAALWVRWYHFGSMYALIESEIIEVDAQKFRELTTSRGSVFFRATSYAQKFSKNMWDSHGYAWDVPISLMYKTASEGLDGGFSWWEREVVDAEMQEAAWWGNVGLTVADEDVDESTAASHSDDEPGLAATRDGPTASDFSLTESDPPVYFQERALAV